ncbi:putative inorganic phosphate cotransporter isoform X5 [Aethina tumida]|uniref:putative inorganic phosphate cotransporter isoform X5 n=1 Tax=Aethina tumida TaxID=116153 RepID=UPI0021493621|nr:putative inorganic phosphate cotransporter isoform X5 [Aethina tumida]
MLQGWRLTVSKFFFIPQRYVLGLMGFLAIVNAYTMRVSLSIAITEMVAASNSTEIDDPDACPADDSGSSGSVTNADKLYDWDEQTQGLILSSFYWGYVITHIPGGILAEKFGGKYTLGLGILSTAVFTLITPWVITGTNGNAHVLVALRVIEGLGEGTTYPALNALLAQWVPISERARIGTLVYAGGQIGTIVTNLISGSLIKYTEDWASVFYLFGGMGVVWVVVWMLICYSDPESHPFISDKEREYLQKELGSVSPVKRTIPWKAILTSVPLWALVAAQVGHDWGFFTMVTDLPKYMKDVLKFDVEANGVWSSVPYVVMWIVSMVFGWFCDYLTVKKFIGVTMARKVFTSIASAGPAIFIIIASYSGCDRMLAVWMFTIAMGFMGTFYCGMKVNALDLSPNFAGTLMAIVNGVGAITGIIAPYLAGALTPNHTLTEWRTVFWVSFAIFMVTNVIYTIWASGEEQWWNNAEEHKQKDGKVENGTEK